MKRSMTNRLQLLRKALLATTMGIALLTAQTSNAQTAYKAPGADVKVLGSSNLHDWKMKAENPVCDAKFTVANNQLTAVNALSFTVQVKNLKSGESLMDSRAYSTLNADKYTTITFNLTSGTIERQGSGYLIKANGNLNISGVSRPVTLNANGVLNADKSITVSGS